MFQRPTILALAHYFADSFWVFGGPNGNWVAKEDLHDLLYAGGYPQGWLDNPARFRDRLDLKNFVLWLADEPRNAMSGIALLAALEATDVWLRRLAVDLLKRDQEPDVPDWAKHPHARDKLLRQLELEGLAFIGGKLLPSESEALEVQEEAGELAATYARLGLTNAKIVENHLALSVEFYGANKFHDAIGNARHYLEQVLLDVAEGWSGSARASAPLTGRKQPIDVRTYLESEKIFTTHEINAIRFLYALLSETGGHPGMSERDQARIFRRLALALAQFTLLRYEAKTQPPGGGRP